MTALEMTEAALRRLLADLQSDILILEAVDTRLKGQELGRLDDEATRALVAVELHRYYTALESAFERIARTVDGHMPSGEGWHRDLLRQMSLPLHGARDAVVSAEVSGDLSHLLSFRHFFRHAYAVEFDASRLDEHRERVARVHPHVKAGLEGFCAHIEATLRSLGDGS